MTIAKRAGIWMDHSHAHIMALTSGPMVITPVSSDFTHIVKESTLEKSEVLIHNKEQHLQSAFYKKLGNIIKQFEDVVLFGPTEAKQELLNLIEEDDRFSKIKIRAVDADKMTGHQQEAFVRSYFYKEL